MSLASEGKQRTLAAGAVGDNITAEIATFTFIAANGGDEVPFVYVPNLIARTHALANDCLLL